MRLSRDGIDSRAHPHHQHSLLLPVPSPRLSLHCSRMATRMCIAIFIPLPNSALVSHTSSRVYVLSAVDSTTSGAKVSPQLTSSPHRSTLHCARCLTTASCGQRCGPATPLPLAAPLPCCRCASPTCAQRPRCTSRSLQRIWSAVCCCAKPSYSPSPSTTLPTHSTASPPSSRSLCIALHLRAFPSRVVHHTAARLCFSSPHSDATSFACCTPQRQCTSLLQRWETASRAARCGCSSTLHALGRTDCSGAATHGTAATHAHGSQRRDRCWVPLAQPSALNGSA